MKTTTRIVRFCAGGWPGVLAYYLVLYGLTEWAKVWYIYSAIIGRLLNITITFLIQRSWTFENKEARSIHKQYGKYFTIALLFWAANTCLLYLLVEYGHMEYLLAQLILTVLLSIPSFFITKWIFKIRPTSV